MFQSVSSQSRGKSSNNVNVTEEDTFHTKHTTPQRRLCTLYVRLKDVLEILFFCDYDELIGWLIEFLFLWFICWYDKIKQNNKKAPWWVVKIFNKMVIKPFERIMIYIIIILWNELSFVCIGLFKCVYCSRVLSCCVPNFLGNFFVFFFQFFKLFIDVHIKKSNKGKIR